MLSFDSVDNTVSGTIDTSAGIGLKSVVAVSIGLSNLMMLSRCSFRLFDPEDASMIGCESYWKQKNVITDLNENKK